MSRIWKKKTSRYIAQYPVFRLREDLCVSPRNGTEMPVFILETSDWINIIPITTQGEVVMVRQFRFGVEEVTLEIPGGLVDNTDVSANEAARRELLEETGYDSEFITYLGGVRPNPAIFSNTCHIFIAQEVTLKQEQNLDDGEDIHVEKVPLDQIDELILNGTIDNALVLNAFHMFDLVRRHKPDLLQSGSNYNL